MIRKFIKKLLAPMIREILKEESEKIKVLENQSHQSLSDVVQEAILKTVNSVFSAKTEKY
jgi:hypothetical protein